MLVRTLLAAMALALAVAGIPGRAGAQCRLCTVPTTAPEVETSAPVALQVEANLDFDRIVLAGSGEGSATLGPDGSRRTSGTIVSIGGRAMVGSIMVRGEPGRSVLVTLPGRITLHGADRQRHRHRQRHQRSPEQPANREGVELKLVAADGKLAGTAQTDFDGYFLFDRVAYAHYNVRFAQTSAIAIHAAVALGASVSGDKPTVRLGALRAVQSLEVASSGGTY